MKITHFAFLLLFLLSAFPLSLAAQPEARPVSLVRVVDGDTIRALLDGKETKIRVYGIDCPERNQPFGEYATGATAMALIGKKIRVLPLYEDRYERTVAVVLLENGSTLEEWLVLIGAAWVYPQYCDRPECAEWERLQEESRERGLGLWSGGRPVPPWEWRKR